MKNALLVVDAPPVEKASFGSRSGPKPPGSRKGFNPRRRVSKPDNPMKNANADPRYNPPPQPKNLSSGPSPLKNDPVAVDYMLGGDELGMIPVVARRYIGIEASAWPELVETTYRSLSAQNSVIFKLLPPSVFALYCSYHLQYRLIQLKKARNERLSSPEDEFFTAFSSSDRPLPKPLVQYLAGMGHISGSDREQFWVLPKTEMNVQGHFGPITTATAINYATCLSLYVVMARVVAELNPSQPFQANWALPASLVPTGQVYTPNTNLLGYYPVQPVRSEASARYSAMIGGVSDVD